MNFFWKINPVISHKKLPKYHFVCGWNLIHYQIRVVMHPSIYWADYGCKVCWLCLAGGNIVHNHPEWQSWCSDWLSGSELTLITFNLGFISDLLVCTRYHPGLSLAQWFGILHCLDEDFVTTLCVDEKRTTCVLSCVLSPVT